MSNAAGTTPQENDAQDDEGAKKPVYSNKNDSKNEDGKNSDKDSDEGEMLEKDAREFAYQWFAENPLIYYDYEIELSDEWTSGVEQGAYWFDLYIGNLFYDIIWIDTVTGGVSMGEGDMSVPMDQWYAEPWLPRWEGSNIGYEPAALFCNNWNNMKKYFAIKYFQDIINYI
ncbi:MAG: hypothetical protein K2N90_07605 [Lachnospiraceae bacterium]|nr:hypothetical protein [Lachnospiraceae bacterium]